MKSSFSVTYNEYAALEQKTRDFLSSNRYSLYRSDLVDYLLNKLIEERRAKVYRLKSRLPNEINKKSDKNNKSFSLSPTAFADIPTRRGNAVHLVFGGVCLKLELVAKTLQPSQRYTGPLEERSIPTSNSGNFSGNNGNNNNNNVVSDSMENSFDSSRLRQFITLKDAYKDHMAIKFAQCANENPDFISHNYLSNFNKMFDSQLRELVQYFKTNAYTSFGIKPSGYGSKLDHENRRYDTSSAQEAFLSTYGETLGIKSIPEGFEVHHIVPRELGGPNLPCNYLIIEKNRHRGPGEEGIHYSQNFKNFRNFVYECVAASK